MAHYRAYCPCGYTVKEGDQSKTFYDPFFLPDRCKSCGDLKGKRWYDSNTWIVEYGEWVRDKVFRLLNFKTWFSNYTWRKR